MIFLPLILFSLVAGSGLFGAQGQQVSILPMRQYEIKPFSGPITMLGEGNYRDPRSGKKIALIRVGIGKLLSPSYAVVHLQVPELLPFALQRDDELDVTLFSPISSPDKFVHELPFRIVASRDGISDYIEDKATGVKQAISRAGQIMTVYLVTRDGKSIVVGFSDGTVRLYQDCFVGLQPRSEVKLKSWSTWFWATLRKPKVYVPMLLLCAAAVCGGYYGKSCWVSKLKKLYAK